MRWEGLRGLLVSDSAAREMSRWIEEKKRSGILKKKKKDRVLYFLKRGSGWDQNTWMVTKEEFWIIRKEGDWGKKKAYEEKWDVSIQERIQFMEGEGKSTILTPIAVKNDKYYADKRHRGEKKIALLKRGKLKSDKFQAQTQLNF